MQPDLTTVSDDQLQKFLNQGQEKAFDQIYERYWKRLYAYAFRIYQEEKICEDIVQAFGKNQSLLPFSILKATCLGL